MSGDKKFDLVTILPGFIIGPNFNTVKFGSGDAIKKFMLKEIPGLVNTKLGSIDVRDCALAHLKAIKVPEAAGKRFILVSRGIWIPELAGWLDAAYGDCYDIPSWHMPRCLISLGSYMSEEMKYLISNIDKNTRYDNSATINVLGIEFRDLKTATLDMAETLIATKYIPDYRVSKPPLGTKGFIGLLFELILFLIQASLA